MEIQIANGTVLRAGGIITKAVHSHSLVRFTYLHFTSIITSAFLFVCTFFIEIKQWEATLLLGIEISGAYTEHSQIKSVIQITVASTNK